MEQFVQVRGWITTLKQASVEAKGYGYRIGYREVQHRRLWRAKQLLPDTLSFDTRDDLLRFIQKKQAFPALYQTGLETVAEFPVLRAWLLKYPTKLMEYAAIWSALLAVCRYFLLHPRPERYLPRTRYSRCGQQIYRAAQGYSERIAGCGLAGNGA